MTKAHLLLAFLVVSLVTPKPSAAEPPEDKPAEEGCVWARFSDARLGLNVGVEECKGFIFKTNGNTLHGVRLPESEGVSWPVLTVFTKDPERSIEKALEEEFLAKLTGDDKKHCRLKKTASKSDPSKLTYRLQPDKVYQRKLDKASEGEEAISACGPYGNMEGYFLYRPKESKARYAFIKSFQDDSFRMDEDSTFFVMKPEATKSDASR